MATGFGRHFQESLIGDLSSLYHILSLRSLWSLAGFIINGIAFVQGLETVAADGGEVNKQIVSPIFRSNETEPF